jgi:hypothetical protein
MLGMSKSRDTKRTPGRDKENTTPPRSAVEPAPVHTPIWAEFSSQPVREVTSTTKVPLNDRRSIEEEIALYTPSNYSPSKQRNFGGYNLPSLQKRQPGERPKSTFLPNTGSSTLLDTFSRKRSNERVPLGDTKGNGGTPRDDAASAQSVKARSMLRRSNSGRDKKKDDAKRPASPPKKPNRVMAAVAAFNGRTKEAQTPPASPTKLDPLAVEAEFEAVLVRLICLYHLFR